MERHILTIENTDLIARVYLYNEQPPGYATRASTEPPEKDYDLDELPYLELKFSHIPRTSSGLVFGTDPNTSDIVLPGGQGLSRRHFALTYKNKFDDGYYRLIVRDLGSIYGTVPHKHLKFRIVVACHNLTSPVYIDNIERFRRGAANAEDLLGGLGLQSGPETERNSGAHTPVTRPILLPLGWIANGGFGVISRHWNISTGEEYAYKQLSGKYKKKD
ncbi:DNA damage response protein kinase DUN1 [Zalerion maritima]|uniref:DNA damage response protein kinase DUN1 n=1 Tax=Zalerion maritima TaxID=339359 RepID=A0AAD5RLH4_9PEZI|nr:DNA damage response protein kinase DUN1 [Zalerion maritima]